MGEMKHDIEDDISFGQVTGIFKKNSSISSSSSESDYVVEATEKEPTTENGADGIQSDSNSSSSKVDDEEKIFSDKTIDTVDVSDGHNKEEKEITVSEMTIEPGKNNEISISNITGIFEGERGMPSSAS